MMNRYLTKIFGELVDHFLKDKIRRGSIQAVKGYIHGVKLLRLGAIGLFIVGAISAVMVTGLVLLVIGLLQLLPLEPMAAAIILMALGALMIVVPAFFLYGAFREKLWLEKSKSLELMDAVLSPWDGNFPPNPFAAAAPEKPIERVATTPEATESLISREHAASTFAHNAQLATPLV